MALDALDLRSQEVAWVLDALDGAGQLIDILTGKTTDKITQWKHDELSTFGIGKDLGDTGGAASSASCWPPACSPSVARPAYWHSRARQL